MQDLLFESRGGSEKRKIALRLCAFLVIACGMAMFLLWVLMPSYVSIKKIVPYFGAAAILIGALITWLAERDFTSRAFLLIYQDHVEGQQVAPDRAFSLKYEEIYNVRKVEMFFNEFLAIETAHEQFAVQVDDAQSACRLINEKLDELEAM